MTGVYARINSLLKYLDDGYDRWRCHLFYKAVNKAIPFEFREKHEFKVDSVKKTILITGRNINFFNDSVYDEMSKEYPLPEEEAEKLFKYLQAAALEDIDQEFKKKEEEQRQSAYDKRKKSYLNTKLFGQSFDFIMED